jgi:hypothetical protein
MSWAKIYVLATGITVIFAVAGILMKLGPYIIIAPHLIVFMIITSLVSTAFYVFVLARPTYFFTRKNPYLRVILPIIVVLTVMFGLPASVNLFARAHIQFLLWNDIDLDAPITVDQTVAVLRDGEARKDTSHTCAELCQRLLFSGAAETVITATPPNGTGQEPPRPAVAYRIERRPVCPEVPDALPTVQARVALGDCLIGTPSTLEHASLRFVDRHLPTFGDMWRILAHGEPLVDAWRVEVSRRQDGEWDRLFRRTIIQARFLQAPFFLNAGIPHPFPIGSASKRINWSFPGARPRILDTVFGEAIDLPDPPPFDLRAVVRRGLESDVSEPTEGHRLFGEYLRDLRTDSGPPTQTDVAVVERAVRDPRVASFPRFGAVIARLEEVPPGLVEALGARLVATPDKRFLTDQIARAIVALPPGAASPIIPDLLAVVHDPATHYWAGDALERLADGDPAVAVEVFRSVLEARQRRPGEAKPPRHRSKLSDIPSIMTATLRGLCRLGPEGRPLADLVLSALRRSASSGGVDRLRLHALVAMGRADSALDVYAGTSEEATATEWVVHARTARAELGPSFCASQ